MTYRMLRLRIIASKEDNPWLPEDLVGRNSVIKCSLGKPLPDWTPEQEAVFDAEQVIRAMFHRLEREGLL